MPNPYKDYQKFWSSHPEGQENTIDFAGGSLYKTGPEQATYTSGGKSINITPSTPLADIASKNPAISQAWESAYGPISEWGTRYPSPQSDYAKFFETQPVGEENKIPWAGGSLYLRQPGIAAYSNPFEGYFNFAPDTPLDVVAAQNPNIKNVWEEQYGPMSTWGMYGPASAPAAPPPSIEDVEPLSETSYRPPQAPPVSTSPQASLLGYTPPPEATVEGRLTGLLSSGSRYLQNARLRAKELANERGLLNSSMAAGAAERAAIEAGLPIAQQDAAAFQEAGMTGYRGDIERELTGYKGAIEGSLLEQQGAIEKALAAQAQGYNLETIGKQAEYSSLLSAQASQQDIDLETVKQQGANERLAIESEADKELSLLNISSGDKEIASRTIADLGDSYMRHIVAIQADPNIPKDTKTEVIEQARFQYEENVRVVAEIYGIELDWLEPETTEEE